MNKQISNSLVDFLNEKKCHAEPLFDGNLGQPIRSWWFFKNYKKYCASVGVDPLSHVQFNYYLKKLNFSKRKNEGGYTFVVYLPKSISKHELLKLICADNEL